MKELAEKTAMHSYGNSPEMEIKNNILQYVQYVSIGKEIWRSNYMVDCISHHLHHKTKKSRTTFTPGNIPVRYWPSLGHMSYLHIWLIVVR